MDARLYGVYEAGTGREQLRQYGNGLREGLRFIAAEKGLLILIAFMALSELCHNVMNTVTLPWFKSAEGLGVQAYTWLGVFGVAGPAGAGLNRFARGRRRLCPAQQRHAELCAQRGAHPLQQHRLCHRVAGHRLAEDYDCICKHRGCLIRPRCFWRDHSV